MKQKQVGTKGEAAPRPEYYGKTNARNKVNYTIATLGGDGWNGTFSGWPAQRERQAGRQTEANGFAIRKNI